MKKFMRPQFWRLLCCLLASPHSVYSFFLFHIVVRTLCVYLNYILTIFRFCFQNINVFLLHKTLHAKIQAVLIALQTRSLCKHACTSVSIYYAYSGLLIVMDKARGDFILFTSPFSSCLNHMD